MVLSKTSSVLLLQVAAFFSAVSAGSRCRPPVCSPSDAVVSLLSSEDGAVAFCSDFLSLPVSTVVGATVTPTVLATVTETSYVTETTAEYDETITVTVPAPTTTSLAPVKRQGEDGDPTSLASAAYPTWLPATYPASRVSSACACLSIPLSVATGTVTAEAVTVTTPVTITGTLTTTLTGPAIVTVTAKPLVTKRTVKIEILRKDTQASVGWLYYSNGPAIATDSSQAAVVDFTLPSGATTASAVRISLAGVTPPTIGFLKSSNPTNIVELEDNYGSLAMVQATPPNSRPAVSGSDKYESDIWTVNTQTKMIGWQWVATSGALPTIYLYRVGGRLYPVGNVNQFNSATGGVSSSKYEVVLRYRVETETLVQQ